MTITWAAFLLPALASCSKEPTELLDNARALSVVAADEAAAMAGANKQITMIAPDANWGPPSTVVRDFEAALKKRGFSVTTKAVNVGDPMSSEVGLKSGDFFDALEKSQGAGAIVSFAGAPLLKPGEFQRLPSARPPILVIATGQLGVTQGVPGNRRHLIALLNAKIIQAAIIDGADPSSKPTGKADAAHELFAQHYRTLR